MLFIIKVLFIVTWLIALSLAFKVFREEVLSSCCAERKKYSLDAIVIVCINCVIGLLLVALELFNYGFLK